ncbi:MAG: hypothetical protein KY439_07245, partial [Actinobacteria bacterium]|nr:hypothetical protein [Actinomycetota bacterium]
PRIVEYIARDGRLETFYGHVLPLLDFLLPQYVAEGKAHLVVAVGCTGGRHRSVAIAEHLAAHYGGGGPYLVEAGVGPVDVRLLSLDVGMGRHEGVDKISAGKAA